MYNDDSAQNYDDYRLTSKNKCTNDTACSAYKYNYNESKDLN